jgi:WD40 repeat protein
MDGSPQAIVALKFTSNNTTLLSSNAQNLVVMWDVQSGHRLKTTPGVIETYWPGSVALSPDDTFLATASPDQSIKVWDVNSGQLLHSFPCQAGRLGPVAWSSDQHLLACGTDYGTILLWEKQARRHLMTLRSDRPYERMRIGGVTGITEAQKASLKTLGALSI